MSTPLRGSGQESKPEAGLAVLTGRVSEATTDSVAVSLRENLLDPTEKLFCIRLGSNGEFRLAVPVTGPTKARLVYGGHVAPLFLDPGTDLDLRFRGSDMAATLRFKANNVPTGLAAKLRNDTNLTDEQHHRQQAANANNYMIDVANQFVENDAFQVLPNNIQLSEASFLSFLEYRRRHEFELLEDHAARQSFTQEFYNYAHAEVVYAYANDKLTFQDLREQVVNTEGRLIMAPDYYNFLRELGLLNEPNAAQSELYYNFLLNYVHFAVVQNHCQRTEPDFYPACYALASKKLTGLARAVILGRVLQEAFRFGLVKQAAAMLVDFRNYDLKTKFYPGLLADFNQHKDFGTGVLVPYFALASATADTVHLHDFVGQLASLSFWKTTNCLCLNDLGYAPNPMHWLEGKNSININCALDENEAAGRQLVATRPLSGVQLATPWLRHPLGPGACQCLAGRVHLPAGRPRKCLPQYQAKASEQLRRSGQNQLVVQ